MIPGIEAENCGALENQNEGTLWNTHQSGNRAEFGKG